MFNTKLLFALRGSHGSIAHFLSIWVTSSCYEATTRNIAPPSMSKYLCVYVYIYLKSIAIIHWHVLHRAATSAGGSDDSVDCNNIL